MNHQKDPPGTYTGAPQGPPHLQNIPGKDTSLTKRHGRLKSVKQRSCSQTMNHVYCKSFVWMLRTRWRDKSLKISDIEQVINFSVT